MPRHAGCLVSGPENLKHNINGKNVCEVLPCFWRFGCFSFFPRSSYRTVLQNVLENGLFFFTYSIILLFTSFEWQSGCCLQCWCFCWVLLFSAHCLPLPLNPQFLNVLQCQIKRFCLHAKSLFLRENMFSNCTHTILAERCPCSFWVFHDFQSAWGLNVPEPRQKWKRRTERRAKREGAKTCPDECITAFRMTAMPMTPL